MRVLLDECLPRKLKRHFPNYKVSIVPEMGWAGIKNGALLRLVEPSFDVFVTMDSNMPHQQNLSSFQLAFILFVAKDNTYETLEPLMPEVAAILPTLTNGKVVRITASNSPAENGRKS